MDVQQVKYFLFIVALLTFFSGCIHFRQMRKSTPNSREFPDVSVSAINFIPIHHPRFINNP